ncbi:hypothetical protein D3C78_531200 [compost metagenome]
MTEQTCGRFSAMWSGLWLWLSRCRPYWWMASQKCRRTALFRATTGTTAYIDSVVLCSRLLNHITSTWSNMPSALVMSWFTVSSGLPEFKRTFVPTCMPCCSMSCWFWISVAMALNALMNAILICAAFSPVKPMTKNIQPSLVISYIGRGLPCSSM